MTDEYYPSAIVQEESIGNPVILLLGLGFFLYLMFLAFPGLAIGFAVLFVSLLILPILGTIITNMAPFCLISFLLTGNPLLGILVSVVIMIFGYCTQENKEEN